MSVALRLRAGIGCLVALLLATGPAGVLAKAQGDLPAPVVEEALRQISSQAGLVYFYISTCPYCRKQEPLLVQLEQVYGLRILPVSLDGGAPPTGAWLNYRLDRGESLELGVQVTPTLVLAVPERNELYLIAEGFIGFEELQRRILLAGVRSGLVKDARFEGAQLPLSDESRAYRRPMISRPANQYSDISTGDR